MLKLDRQNEIDRTLAGAWEVLRDLFEPHECLNGIAFLLFLRLVSDIKPHTIGATNEEAQPFDSLPFDRFLLPPEFNFWRLYENRGLRGNGQRLDGAMSAIEQTNQELIGVFQVNKFNSSKSGIKNQSDEILKLLLEHFSQKSLDFRQDESASASLVTYAFEFLLATYTSSIEKRSEELVPPRELSELLANLLQPKNTDRIYDPACGSGDMLLRCAEIARNNSEDGSCSLYGQEKNSFTWSLAKLNMIFHHISTSHIVCGDTLREPLLTNGQSGLMHFDIVVGNPPFSMAWSSEDAQYDKFSRFHRGVPPRSRADYAFISHMIESLEPKLGRMAIVVPLGVLFRGGIEGKIRQNLIDENLIDAVIGLPPKLFMGTAIPTAILLLRKNKTETSIIFIDGSNDFESKKIQNKLTPAHIKRLQENYFARQSVEGFSQVVSLEDIRGKGYNLNIPLYVHVAEPEVKIDIQSVRAERMELVEKIAELEQKLENTLNKIVR